ncbi:phage head-tail joining protein [Jhaorihella thermophila]
MADLAQLTAWRDALMAARYQGVRTVEYDGKRVTYASDGEMAAALADLNRQIAGRPTASRSSASNPRKGSEMKNVSGALVTLDLRSSRAGVLRSGIAYGH